MRLYLFVFLLLSGALVSAQSPSLVAKYSFESANCEPLNDVGAASNNGIIGGNPVCACGVRGQGLRFDGNGDRVAFAGGVNDQFDTEDFSISFYFKPEFPLASTPQTLLSKRDLCSNDNAFAIRFTPSNYGVSVVFRENDSFDASLSAILDESDCWHHVVVIRRSRKAELWINGELLDFKNSGERPNITNNIPLTIGASSCNVTDVDFKGIIDELRVYDNAISERDIQGLYYRPDEILTGYKPSLPKDTSIFLGQNFQLRFNNTCSANFFWSPATGVSDINASNPILSPTETTVYRINYNDNICVGFDTITVNVIDPADLDCAVLYFPNAFTPNEDNLNETFGPDNPYVVVDPGYQLDVFNQKGLRVFTSSDPNEKWDGTYLGKKMPNGVYAYKVVFTCKGFDFRQTGSIRMMK